MDWLECYGIQLYHFIHISYSSMEFGKGKQLTLNELNKSIDSVLVKQKTDRIIAFTHQTWKSNMSLD